MPSKVMLGWESHLTYRLMAMMRGQLISLIYNKMMVLPITGTSESAAMTLMGTDVQSIAASYHFLLLDIVPAAVQLSVAIYLLYDQLGVVCVAPLLVALGKSRSKIFRASFSDNSLSLYCTINCPCWSSHF